MTTHLQGRSSRGPGTITRCLTTLSTFRPSSTILGGSSNSSSSSSSSSSKNRSSSKPQPEAIELHEWKPSSAQTRGQSEKADSRASSAQDDQDQVSLTTNTTPVVNGNHGGDILRWLRKKSGSVWWGPVLLLLLLLLLASNSPTAAAASSSSETLRQTLTEAWYNAGGAPEEKISKVQEILRESEGAPETQAQGPPGEGLFEVDGASSRRLNSLSAWAADMEASLRLSPTLSLYLGVFLTLSGSLLMAGGSTLMKLGLSVEEADSLRGQSCDQQWLWGFAAYVAGACMHVVALGFAPASVLSPMNSIGLIANAVASATVLKEPFGFQELLFTGGCAFGVFLCACASVLPRTEFVDLGSDLDSRYIGLYSWRDPWYLAFLGVCCGLGFGALVYLNSVESALLEEKEQQLLRQSDRDIALLTHPSSPSQ
ncbi:hypothetical protein, conserved [Eimeria praecox]|uniref:DUF803 domain-containing protein n=1 Tax=Eimeria praecox TaxID=51316 RepID=U6H4Y9_9EIME|nr:hypothetical protein, conserved [Eimeria praecox]